MRMTDFGEREGDISLRGGDIGEKADDNWEKLELLILWSVNLKPIMSKFLPSFKGQS